MLFLLFGNYLIIASHCNSACTPFFVASKNFTLLLYPWFFVSQVGSWEGFGVFLLLVIKQQTLNTNSLLFHLSPRNIKLPPSLFFNVFTHQQKFVEHLLCGWHCSRC